MISFFEGVCIYMPNVTYEWGSGKYFFKDIVYLPYKRQFYNRRAPTGIMPTYSKNKAQFQIKSMYHNHMTILALYCHPPKTRVIV